MEKWFVCRRTPHEKAVMEGTIGHVRQSLDYAENHYGRNELKTQRVRLLLAVMYCVVEDHEHAEQLLTEYLAAAKTKRTLNPRELFWASSLLAETYFEMNRIPGALVVTGEAKPISKLIDSAAMDPILEGLVQRAHLTKYDFVGLLSIVLGKADFGENSVDSWLEQEPRVIEVR